MSKSPKRLIFLTVFVDLLGFGMIIPILPWISSLYPRGLGLGPGVGAGLLMLAFSLLQMLFSPFWGRLSDRYGRRPILLVSLACSTLSYLMFAFADSYGVLLASRILAGIGSANITAAQAYIADITSHKERTSGMALIGIAFGLGFVFGPVLGGCATHIGHWVNPLANPHWMPGLIASAICGVNFVWALFKLPESLPQSRRNQVHFRRFATMHETLANLRHPAIGPLIILFFLVTFAFANLEVSFVIYSKEVLHVGQKHIYLFFAYIGLIMVIVQGFLVRRAVKVIPEHLLMIPGIALLAVGLFIMPFGTHLPYVFFTLTILSVGQAASTPCILSLISRSADVRSQGNVMGTSQSASSLARIVGPAVGGVLYDFGPRMPFWVASVIMALTAGWAVYTSRQLLVFNNGGEALHLEPSHTTNPQSSVS